MTSNDPAPTTPRAWEAARLAFWFGVTVVVLCFQGPAFRLAFDPSFFPPGFGFFLPDFYQEWASARNLFEGLPIYTPHEITVEHYFGFLTDARDPYFIKENAHPPAAVLLGLPFAFFDFQDALVLWNLLSLALFAATLWLIFQTLQLTISWWQVLAGFCLLLLCYPFVQQMVQGQLNLLLLFLFTVAWRADRAGNVVAAGIWTGAAACFKIFPAFLVVYFLFLGKWRALLSGGLAFLALSLTAGIVLGFDCYHDYFFEILPRTAEWRTSWHNFSLPAVSFKLFEAGKYFPPITVRPLLENSAVAWASALVSLAVLTAIVGRAVVRFGSHGDTDRAYSLTIIAMLLASPITWDHYFLILALPLAVIWPRLTRGRREILILLLAVLWVSPRKVAEHALILLHGSPESAGPWETVTALSIQCYAELGILALAAWAAPAKVPETAENRRL